MARYVPHFLNRGLNSLGISIEDFTRMTELADTHPELKEALERAKMIWILVDPDRRPDR